jgi:hypothetical protein
MKIKIQHNEYGLVWLVKYKQIGRIAYNVHLSAFEEDAGQFDDDDYIKNLCCFWWGKDVSFIITPYPHSTHIAS